MISRIRDFFQGKKTYLVAVTTFILGGLAACGYEVPVWVYPLLGALGLTTLRAGVDKAGQQVPKTK